MGYMYTCKYCHRLYDDGFDSDFHSYDCKLKYDADQEAMEERLAEERQARYDHTEALHQRDMELREERERARDEAEYERELAREEERARREALREEREERRSAKEERKQAFLMSACEEGNLDEVMKMLREASIEVDFTHNGKNPLIYCLREGKFDIASALISYGRADPNYTLEGFSLLAYCLLDNNRSGIDLLRKSSNFRYELSGITEIVSLFRSLTKPSNHVAPSRVLEIFHDRALLSESARSALKIDISQNEARMASLLIYATPEFVKEALGIDVNQIKADQAAQREEARQKKEEEELKRKREEAEEWELYRKKKQAEDEASDKRALERAGIYELLEKIEKASSPIQRCKLGGKADFVIEREVEGKLYNPAPIAELKQRIKKIQDETESSLGYRKATMIWNKNKKSNSGKTWKKNKTGNGSRIWNISDMISAVAELKWASSIVIALLSISTLVTLLGLFSQHQVIEGIGDAILVFALLVTPVAVVIASWVKNSENIQWFSFAIVASFVAYNILVSIALFSTSSFRPNNIEPGIGLTATFAPWILAWLELGLRKKFS